MHSNGLNASGFWNGKKRPSWVKTYSGNLQPPSNGLKKKVSHYTSYIYHLRCTIKAEGE